MDHLTFAQLLGSYGEFIGAIALAATLVYLTVQVRHDVYQKGKTDPLTSVANARFGDP